jgi:ADP-ribose pyrophosphatase
LITLPSSNRIMTPHGPWNILSSRTAYQDPWLTVTVDEVLRPDGQPGTHSVARLRPGISVLALGDDDMIHLTEEFHYGVGRTTLEVVSGGIEDGEDPLETARRELREELGIEAADWTPLGSLDPLTTSLVSPARLYLARKLSFAAANPEGTEQIRHIQMPFTAAIEAVMTGAISHAPSGLLILKAARLLGR